MGLIFPVSPWTSKGGGMGMVLRPEGFQLAWSLFSLQLSLDFNGSQRGFPQSIA